MSDRQHHQQNRARALSERTNAIHALISRCRRMTPEEFASMPASAIRRLSAKQFSGIVAHIVSVPQPAQTAIGAVSPGSTSAPLPSVRRGRSRSLGYRMMLTSLTCGLLASGLIAMGLLAVPFFARREPVIRPQNANHWPMCPRLSTSVDGCLYRVTNRLAWQDAARWLAIPEAELRRVNDASGGVALEAGQRLLIWRGRGQLTR